MLSLLANDLIHQLGVIRSIHR